LTQLILNQQHAAGRRARYKRAFCLTRSQLSDILKMKTVNIFFGGDCLCNALFIELIGQRQLYEDSVNRRVGVEVLDELKDSVL
jgi:hypothetical protein